MDFTEAPCSIQEKIMASIAADLGVEFDENNSQHMEMAQEAMEDDWSGN